MPFISVHEAERIILSHTGDFGVEQLPFDKALGRVLAENIVADRDLPPYNRVTMDGIAISHAAFAAGIRTFRIKAIMAAGDAPIDIQQADECIELMTGCALPATLDTVIRYEDVAKSNGIATVTAAQIKQGANIHRKGKDKLAGGVVVPANTLIDATVINMAASVGSATLLAKKLPTVIIVSTGDELVAITDVPEDYQIRRSNSYAIQAELRHHGINADVLHVNDDPAASQDKIEVCLTKYDVIILSGGVSMGRYDFVPEALDALGVKKLFHKVQQRPGKPFWFGVHEQSNTRVFAFPGNPVSAFLCLHRYFVPWLRQNGTTHVSQPTAMLAADFAFAPALQYFLQVHLCIDSDCRLIATPVEGNGSGDFANLLLANAFMELPAEVSNFKKGDIYKVWPFKSIV